jgi:hypothetical protein
LVADAAAGGEEVDGVLAGEALDVGVLPEVLLALVLDVVIEGEDGLSRIVDRAGANIAEPAGGRSARSYLPRIATATRFEITGPVLSCVITCCGWIVTKSPARTRLAPGARSTAWALTIFSTSERPGSAVEVAYRRRL